MQNGAEFFIWNWKFEMAAEGFLILGSTSFSGYFIEIYCFSSSLFYFIEFGEVGVGIVLSN